MKTANCYTPIFMKLQKCLSLLFSDFKRETTPGIRVTGFISTCTVFKLQDLLKNLSYKTCIVFEDLYDNKKIVDIKKKSIHKNQFNERKIKHPTQAYIRF